jgi:hypothetical protein
VGLFRPSEELGSGLISMVGPAPLTGDFGFGFRNTTMTRIVVESPTSELLRQVEAQVELFDEYGLPLGVFTPVDEKELYRHVEIPYTQEELRRLAQQTGRTLAEILADLEKGP